MMIFEYPIINKYLSYFIFEDPPISTEYCEIQHSTQKSTVKTNNLVYLHGFRTWRYVSQYVRMHCSMVVWKYRILTAITKMSFLKQNLTPFQILISFFTLSSISLIFANIRIAKKLSHANISIFHWKFQVLTSKLRNTKLYVIIYKLFRCSINLLFRYSKERQIFEITSNFVLEIYDEAYWPC
jgi:hypothetical protein